MYTIPFKKKPIKIGQGFHGPSHRDWKEDKEDFSYSVDFLLPEKTEIIASRGGIVTKVKINGKENYSGKDSTKGDIAYKKHMNEIEIEHSDGTFAAYAHLFNKSALVKKGQKIRKGQKIALSGNTGWSSAPHLDFSLYRKNIEGYKIKTIKIKFENYSKSLEHKKWMKLKN